MSTSTLPVPLGHVTQGIPVRVFTIPLILEEILKNFSTRDMFLLSETSKNICDLVRNSQKFSRICITLSPRIMTRAVTLDTINDKFPTRWTHVSLEVDGWSVHDLGTLRKILRTVKILELYQQPEGDEKKKTSPKPLTPIKLTDLVDLILSTEDLKSLAFGTKLLCRDLSTMFTEKFQTHLHGLNELKILGYIHSRPPSPRAHVCTYVQMYVLRRFENITTNLAHLLSLAPLPKLTSITIQNVQISYNEEFGFRSGNDIPNSMTLTDKLLELLVAHKNTLEKIDVDSIIWKNPGISEQLFPHLKYLKVESYHLFAKRIGEFLSNQQQLSLNSLSINAAKDDDNTRNRWSPLVVEERIQTLLVGIQGQEMSNLRQLHLELPTAYGDLYGAKSAWDFLDNCYKLEDVKIEFTCIQDMFNCTGAPVRRYRHADGITTIDVTQIMKHIPKEVKHIKISGINKVPPMSLLCSLLPTFTNLFTLDLWNSRKAVDNASLHVIYTTLTHLRHLAFSHCYDVDDVGLNSENDNVNKGIKALLYLEILWIVACPKISIQGILAAVSFNALRELKLRVGDAGFSDDQAIQLVEQNPALEKYEYNLPLVSRQTSVINAHLTNIGRKKVKFLQFSENLHID